MPEGPSLIIAREELQTFVGGMLTDVSGSAKIDWSALKGQKMHKIQTWGKHLLLWIGNTTIRVHFLMFGTYYINSSKDRVPKMSLFFADGSFVHFYTCAVKQLTEPLDALYDWEADVMNEQWNAVKAKQKLGRRPNLLVADALMDQTIFSGVGNIIKNEVCYRIGVHPASRTGALPKAKLNELVREAVNYSYDFLRWKKEGTLKKHWLAHTKKVCSRDGSPLSKEYIGESNRRTFYCPQCQMLYT
jgi:endonuclease VIII